jgi:hypothetical protein
MNAISFVQFSLCHASHIVPGQPVLGWVGSDHEVAKRIPKLKEEIILLTDKGISIFFSKISLLKKKM